MNKLFKFYVLFIVVLLNCSVIQAQKVVWAKGAKNLWGVAGSVLDSHGNSYFGGYYVDSAFFDTTKISAGRHNRTFLAKYRPNGEMVSILQNTGGGEAQITNMCIDNADHIYITGDFEESVTFGSITVNGPYSVYGMPCQYIAKLDTSGNVLWVKVFYNTYNWSSGYENSIITSTMTCDKSGKLYLFGYVTGTANSIDSISLSGLNGIMFIAKLDPSNGTAIWVRQIDQSLCYNCADYPQKILTDGNSNVYVCGTYETFNIVFNAADTLFGGGNYAAKYDQYGNYYWSKRIDSSGGFFCDATIDSNNNLFVSGRNYYAKYRPSGALAWHKNLNFFPFRMCNFQSSNYLVAQFRDSFIYSGDTLLTPGDNSLVFKTDTNTGSLVWKSGSFEAGPINIGPTKSGGVLISGGLRTYPSIYSYLGGSTFVNSNGFVAMICDTSFTPTNSNTIKGNIFNDINSNCLPGAEPGLNGFGVIAEPGHYYAVSDSSGNYSLKVDTGTYVVNEIIPPSRMFTDSMLCSSGVSTHYFASAGNVDTGADIPNKYSTCQFLDVTTTRYVGYQVCDTYHVISVVVNNWGTDTAHNVVLTIKYPGYILSPLFSSITWFTYSATDSLLTFRLGDLPPGSNSSFTVTDTVMCASLYSLMTDTINFKIHVTPNNTCYPADTFYNYVTLPSGFYIPLGIKNISSSRSTISVYPNPTYDKVVVTGLEHSSHVYIANILGQNMISVKNDYTNEQIIDLSALPSGMYFMKIMSGGGSEIRKIVKQ